MKIVLYIEHGNGNGVGGAELMMAYLASEWSREHDVSLVHHRPPLTRARLSAFTNDDLSRVAIRYEPRQPDSPAYGNPWRRYRAARDWHRSLSEGADLFVACTHWLPPFCHARRGALLVLFPFYVRPPDADDMRALPLPKRLRHRAYYDVEWHQRLRTYPLRIAISPFTRQWTRHRWGIDATVIAPPVDVEPGEAAPPTSSGRAASDKEAQILSVGRFSTMAHTKKQLEMASVFRMLADGGMGWRYACVGGLNDRAENHAYFEQVTRTLDGYRATVAANLAPDELRTLFARSSIFWHATGYGDDTDARPELAEHFGIATVEAMAAGCVPLVVNKGGQRDLVQHGQNGFVWDTLDELARYTRRLTADDDLRQRLSLAARASASRFARPRFIQEMSRTCGVPMARSLPMPAEESSHRPAAV